MYSAEDPHLEENDFSLLQFWLCRSKPSTCAETGEVEAGLPYLALIARLYDGIESIIIPVARRKGTFQPFPSLSAACAARSHTARWSD